MLLEGKVAVITGAASGCAQTARLFAAGGARVIVAAVSGVAVAAT